MNAGRRQWLPYHAQDACPPTRQTVREAETRDWREAVGNSQETLPWAALPWAVGGEEAQAAIATGADDQGTGDRPREANADVATGVLQRRQIVAAGQIDAGPKADLTVFQFGGLNQLLRQAGLLKRFDDQLDGSSIEPFPEAFLLFGIQGWSVGPWGQLVPQAVRIVEAGQHHGRHRGPNAGRAGVGNYVSIRLTDGAEHGHGFVLALRDPFTAGEYAMMLCRKPAAPRP
jgi:hypothetical protein